MPASQPYAAHCRDTAREPGRRRGQPARGASLRRRDSEDYLRAAGTEALAGHANIAPLARVRPTPRMITEGPRHQVTSPRPSPPGQPRCSLTIENVEIPKPAGSNGPPAPPSTKIVPGISR